MTLPADIRNERRVITADPMDINKVIPEGLNDENLALDMMKAGQKVMQSSIGGRGFKAQKNRKHGKLCEMF